MTPASLPAGVQVFERGWLSANNVLLSGRYGSALVDSGYFTHSAQTVGLVQAGLAGRALDVLINTHLHSDHCGGNAGLQVAYPPVTTLVPPGQARYVADWDPVALTYQPTGQHCPQFRLDGVLAPGAEIGLGNQSWQIHGAPGHDPHSVVLFEPDSRTLISADALWENGFGVVFEELEGRSAFDEVASTLDLVESLDAKLVIPGHGRLFSDVPTAIAASRRRLAVYRADPSRHALHATKVLVKFKLLEVQHLTMRDLLDWTRVTPYFRMVFARYFGQTEFDPWIESVVSDLQRSGAVTVGDGLVSNA